MQKKVLVFAVSIAQCYWSMIVLIMLMRIMMTARQMMIKRMIIMVLREISTEI